MPNYPLAAECLYAVTGPFPSKPIDRETAAAARTLYRETWPGEVVALLDADAKTTQPRRAPALNYLATWRRLNSRQDDAAVVAGIEVAELKDAYLEVLARARRYLRDNWRPLRMRTFMGLKMLEPGDSELERVRDLYAMVADPSRITSALRSSCILQADVDAIETVLPEVYGVLSALINGEVLRQQTRRKSYEPTYAAQLAVRIFLGEPQGSPIDVVGAADDQGAPEAPPEVPPLDIKREPREAQTKTDRIADLSP